MKEIHQANILKHIFISVCVLCICYSCVVHFHVDASTQERHLTEAEEPGVEFSQEQQQEPEQEPSEEATQEQVSDLTNSSANPEGKHRCIPTPCSTSVKFIFYNLCIYVYRNCIDT